MQAQSLRAKYKGKWLLDEGSLARSPLLGGVG